MRAPKLVFLLLAIFYSSDAFCGLDKFECSDDKSCKGREVQCDGHNDCEDGSDEAECTQIQQCEVEKLSCEATVNNEVINKCYDTKNDICKAGGFNALCDNHEDVQHCRCNPNEGQDKPIRCPTTGKCVKGNTLADFCAQCPDSVTCMSKADAAIQKDCSRYKIDGYFQCIPTAEFIGSESFDKVCLPEAAQCDSFIQCQGSSDTPALCVEATIKLESSSSPAGVYIGDDVVNAYEVKGKPEPTFKIYHYNKEILLSSDNTYSYEGTEISVKKEQKSLELYKYEVTIKNINEYFYGTYDAIAWNVNNEPVDLGDGNDGSYHRRVVAEQVNVKFEGVPTVKMFGPDDEELNGDIDYTWETDVSLSLKCVATGKPEPDIYFMLDGESLYINDDTMEVQTEEYNEVDMLKVVTLVLKSGDIVNTPGRYSCGANSVIGEVVSVGGVKVELIIPPVITEFTGMENGFFFYRNDEEVQISCISEGFPLMWNDLYVDNEKIEGADVEVKRLDAGATLSYTYKSDQNGKIKCIAKNSPESADNKETDEEEVDMYPVFLPTIAVEQESFILTAGDNFKTTIKVEFTADLKLIADQLTAEVVYADGSAVSEAWTLVKKDDTEGNIVEFDLSAADVVGIPNIGDFKVMASDTFYNAETGITIDVLVPMSFIKPIGDNLKLNKGQELTLEVQVIAKPVPVSFAWTLNETELVDDAATIFIEESFDATTYITTYTLRLVDLKEEQTGTISVGITRGDDETLSGSMELEVLAHPCLFFPCKNNAECLEVSKTEYECECTDDFYNGTNCEINNYCALQDPCENESTCESAAWDAEEPIYTCLCPFDYEGRNCSDKINFCDRDKEGNVELGGIARCDEASGFGKCQDTGVEPDGFDCFCKHNKGGMYCDIEQLCTPNSCANDATCTVQGYGEDRVRVCNCNDGWEGHLCDEKTTGYCWTDCNDRAYCEEEGVCLCDYPYYGDTCELHISDVAVNMRIAPRAYLMAETYPLIAEERLQKHVLPLKIEPSPTVSCRIARMSADKDATGDHLDFGISVTESAISETESVTVVAFEVTGLIGEVAVSETVDKVMVAEIVAISLMAVADKYVVFSVEHAGDGGIAAKEMELALPELAFLKLGDFEEGVGCGVVLIGHVEAGDYAVNPAAGYSEGRSVEQLDACYHNPCMNGGECVGDESTGAQSCDCSGTGFTGALCEIPDDESCDKGCLNGGVCQSDFCVCALSFHGVLCEASHEVTGTMKLSGGASEVSFSHSNITAVEIQATGLADATVASDVYLITIGDQDNCVKILVSDTTELYMIVERGKESGAYEGLGSLADYLVEGTLQMSISLGEDIQITNAARDPVVYTADELPCADGLGTTDGLAIHGLEGITSDVTATINGEAATATGGKGVVNSAVSNLCDGACGAGTCEQANNQIKCSGCVEGTNLVTCSDVVCDVELCEGECTDIGECVCELGQEGVNCETAVTLGPLSLPVTTSSYYSYAEYETEAFEGDAAQLEFFAHLDGSEQMGLLAMAGNERQYIAVKLAKDVMTVVAHCSDLVHVEASVSGVGYGEWLEISVTWADNFLTLAVNGDNDVQEEAGLCIFDMGTTIYLGGMPDGSVPSVKATFAPATNMMPLNSRLAGGQSLAVSEIHICDTQFDPCSVLGTDTCEKDDEGYSCMCKDGFKGVHCEAPKTPCDTTVCQDNEVCVEADGSCLCEFPSTRSADEVCQGELGSSTGFIMEGAMSYGHIDTDKAEVANNFDLVFRFYLSDSATVNATYDLATLLYPGEDGTESQIGLHLVVGEEEQVNEANEPITVTIYVLVIPFDESVSLEPNQWHVIRIQTSGLGTTLEVNDKVYSTTELGIPLVNAIHLGVAGNQAYMSCIGDITLNGQPITELDDGLGVKSCSDEVNTEYENRLGVEVWAKLGLL
ncbi:uncharacterized protein LOC134821320 isoform X2 [Bolinopsis microptera]|uniref:uncharacterized protein LOC134821320 isoform X2 n=1 Tax=Bolinopsis microptera TaxID=2820187 RepID=UPI00307A1594